MTRSAASAAAKAKAAKATANALSNQIKKNRDKLDSLGTKKVNFEDTNPKHTEPPITTTNTTAKSNKTSDPPSQERDAELDNLRNHDTYVTLKVDLTTADSFASILSDKYKSFFTTVQLVDNTCILLTANPEFRRPPLIHPADIPNTITGMIPYFHTTSRPAKDKSYSIWVVARLSHDAPWEDIIETSRYELSDDNMLLMHKRIQTFKSQVPGYLQFVDNNADPQDIYSQICDDIGYIFTWTCHNREPFEGNYVAMAENRKKKKNYHANCVHFECADGQEENFKAAIRAWKNDGRAAKRFGPHVKFVECLTKASSPRQTDRTIRMNIYGQRFQASIDMCEIHGLLNPNGIVPVNGKSYTIRELILLQKTPAGNDAILSVTRKWKSNAWQASFIKQERLFASDFTSCPAAYLGHPLDEDARALLYKNFTPDAVGEAVEAEYDEESKRMITSSEKDAMAEEKAIASIDWMIDISAVTGTDTDDSPVKFQDGKDFKFSDDISINTTRTHANTPTTNASTSNSAAYTTPPRGSPSILKSSSSVTSSVTHGSRLIDLEQSMGDMNHDVKNMDHDVQEIKGNIKLMLALVQKSTQANNLTDTNTAPPSSHSGGDGA